MDNIDIPRHVDPGGYDEGPSAEWYRELAETRETPWPRGGHITRLSHSVGFARAIARMPQCWPCRRCGGPKVCPDLAATLPYRECGYLELVDGRWVHQ